MGRTRDARRREEPTRRPVPAPAAGDTGRRSALLDLQSVVGNEATAALTEATVVRRDGTRAKPYITPGNKFDRATKASDAGLGLGAAAKVTGTVPTIVEKGSAAVGEASKAMQLGAVQGASVAADTAETLAAVGEVAGVAGPIFSGIAMVEHGFRGRDAHVRHQHFVSAVERLSPDDPIRPYLIAAAKQQDWERARRMAKVAVSGALLALSVAAIVGTGGVAVPVVGGVLATLNAMEWARTFAKKKWYAKSQTKQAEEILRAGLADDRAGGDNPVVTMLRDLAVPVPARTASGDLDPEQLAVAVKKLAPHLERATFTVEKAIQDRAEKVTAPAFAAAELEIGEALTEAELGQISTRGRR